MRTNDGTRQVVKVRSGRVVDEMTHLYLGRARSARDGTYLWEVSNDGTSRLIPIATDLGSKASLIELGEEGMEHG